MIYLAVVKQGMYDICAPAGGYLHIYINPRHSFVSYGLQQHQKPLDRKRCRQDKKKTCKNIKTLTEFLFFLKEYTQTHT